MLLNAERHKTRAYEIAGRKLIKNIDNSRVQAVLIDEEYLAIGSHLDASIKLQIEAGGYVDLSRLLPKDKVNTEEDHRLEMINKGGLTYWVPLSEKELSPINSYIKWEQAFRVYTNIFAKANPDRVTELLQYNHVIEMASASYPWENVYKYDREFRIHMGEHPERNWSVILQQAWALYIKSGHGNNNVTGGGQTSGNNVNYSPSGYRKVCIPYNAGRCTYGLRCKFDHRCGVCGKRGHGAFNCIRISSERPREDRSSNHHHGKQDGNYKKHKGLNHDKPRHD